MNPSSSRVARRWLAGTLKPGLHRVRNKTLYWNTWALVEPGFKVPNADPRAKLYEDLFEEVRKEVNPSAPSRLKCVFVCPTLGSGFCGGHATRNDFTYEVRVSGKVFATDGGLWSRAREARTVEGIRAYARDYWLPEGPLDLDGEEEILVDGAVIVERRIE
jgi:hypothetical protein